MSNQKIIVLCITKQDYLKRIDRILLDNALFKEPKGRVKAALWNLLVSLDEQNHDE